MGFTIETGISAFAVSSAFFHPASSLLFLCIWAIFQEASAQRARSAAEAPEKRRRKAAGAGFSSVFCFLRSG